MMPKYFWILLAVTLLGCVAAAGSLLLLLLGYRTAADALFSAGAGFGLGGALAYCAAALWEDRPWRRPRR